MAYFEKKSYLDVSLITVLCVLSLSACSKTIDSHEYIENPSHSEKNSNTIVTNQSDQNIQTTPLSNIKNMVKISAGVFQMGCSIADEDCETDEGKQGGVSVHVPTFYIDKSEVTVAEYADCIAAGQCQRPKDYQLNHYCNFGSASRNNHPVNCVDWQEALDYCEYMDKRLPFEAEWEKAARAGTTSRYPWGQQALCEHAILDDGVTKGSAGDEMDGCGEDRTWAVNSRVPNALGIYDMHGNVGEWTMNWYAPNALTEYAQGSLTEQPKSPRKVVRGGSWDETALNLRSSYRNTKHPVSGEGIYGSIGFRCAFDNK